MKSRQLKFYIWLLLLVTTGYFTGCGPNFGDEIYDWVDDNARSYSERLTRADLRVRWLNQFTEHYRLMNSYMGQTDVALRRIQTQVSTSMNREATGMERYLSQNDRCREVFDQLVVLKANIDKTSALFESLDGIGSPAQFQAAGLRAVGKETLMRSFFEIGARHETINKLRYTNFFTIEYRIVIGNDGEVNQETDVELSSAGAYSGDFEGFFASTFPFSPFYALTIEDDLEDQKDRIVDALNLFDKRCLSPKDQFIISMEYLNEAQAKYSEHHQLTDSIHQVQLTVWKQLFNINEAMRQEASAALAPYRRQMAENEFRGREEVQRIMDQEERFHLKTQVIEMMIELYNLQQESFAGLTDMENVERCENFLDATIEAKYILDELHRQTRLVSIYEFLEKYEIRVARLNRNALNKMNTLKTRKP